MRPHNDTTDDRQRAFDSLPLSDSTFDALFQAPESPLNPSSDYPDQEQAPAS
jgi:hypothetical protein